MKLIDILKESTKSTYDYGAAMLYLSFPEMEDIHKLIEKEDIYTEEGDNTFGLEDEPHVTLLYGLHEEVTDEQVEEKIKDITFYTVKFSGPTLFENEKYDVLKFDATEDSLDQANKNLKDLPHTSSYKDYHAHMTIAYVKKGKGKKYVDLLKKDYGKFFLAPQYVVYSKPNKGKSQINIKID